MKPDFILKALSNPDMQDFCSYLETPLEILEELDYRYKKLPLERKVKHCNMVTHLRMDKILNEYLPNMVDNYCEFSFKYRNEEIVKTEQTKAGVVSYTAKEILLQNLSKLIEEINVLETEFNQNNKFELLVQKEILTNLGYAHEIELDNAPSKKVVLENQFKYKPEVKLDLFKKDVEQEMLDEVFTQSVESTQQSSGGLSIVEVLLVVSLIALTMSGAFIIYPKVQNASYINQEKDNLMFLKSGIGSLYGNEPNFNSLNNRVINNAMVSKRGSGYGEELKSSFGGNMKVSGFNNTFKIAYSDMPYKVCSELVKLEFNTFDEIKIGKAVLPKSFNNATIENECSISTSVEFITKKLN